MVTRCLHTSTPDETPLAAAERPYAANADKTPYGGSNYDSYYTYPGNILNPMTGLPVLGLPAEQSGQAPMMATLSPSINLENQFADLQLFPPSVTANELYATVAQDLSDRLQLFFEGRFAERNALQSNFPNETVLEVPPSNPYYVNPFGGVGDTSGCLRAVLRIDRSGAAIFSGDSQVYMATLGTRAADGPNVAGDPER